MKKHMNDIYCIIGGGAVGIGLAKCFTQENISFDMIEREDDFGGNWYFGKSCSKMYRSTHLISSKMNTQFSDFLMPENYPPYPNHKQMLEYLRSIAKYFKLYDHTLFNTTVEKLEPIDLEWKVTLSDNTERFYNGVIIANGLLREPKFPQYPGNFSGKIIHSCEYQSPEILRGKRVLIIGGGNSGCDIAVDSALNADYTVHSTRRGYHYMPKFIDGMPSQDWIMQKASEFTDQKSYWDYVSKTFKTAGFNGVDYGLQKPDHEIYQCHPIMNSQILYYIGHGDITPKPDIKLFDNDHVYFIDDSKEKIDLIIYATGYKMSIPFLDKKYLNWINEYPDLYAYCFHKTYDNLLFAGYVNSPSGLGNLTNSMGKMVVSYLKALQNHSESFEIFKYLKQGPAPNFGNENFIHTDRHYYEVDLWKLIKLLNALRTKFLELRESQNV